MAISKESKESKIVFRKPFDLQEAVILLDVYLTFNKKGASTNAAAKIASQRLRALAVSRGMEIDDSFRSVLGIRKQRFTRGYKRYKETSGLMEWKIGHIFHSIFT